MPERLQASFSPACIQLAGIVFIHYQIRIHELRFLLVFFIVDSKDGKKIFLSVHVYVKVLFFF